MQNRAKRLDIAVEPLRRDTLQDRVYQQISGLILDGGIAPGQQVTIQGLAEAFHVSAMPVREALKRLSAANALTVLSGRSIGIPPLTIERLTDLRNVRVLIEGAATAWAASSIEELSLANLSHLLEQMENATKQRDTAGYLQANRAFHFMIYRAANSPTFEGIVENLWLQIGPYLNLLGESENYVASNVYHRAVLEALSRRDAEAARSAMVEDINGAYDGLVEILK